MSNSKIVERDEECDIFQHVINSSCSEFVALYGRRRVGKTHLVRTFFGDCKGVFFFNVTGARHAPMREQIEHFTEVLSQTFYNGAPLGQPKNWDAAFKLLTDAIAIIPKSKKIVLFFDELPWMSTKNSRLLQGIDYYWNQYWSNDSRIKLIVCGSSASWIIRKIINNKGGLHNRITRKIHLKPFSLSQTRDYLLSNSVRLNEKQITEIYMVTGGVPYYLNQVEKGKSANQVIAKLAFHQDALLLKEFDNLFSSLFDNAEQYVQILRLIAQYRYGVSHTKIAEESSEVSNGGGLKKILEDLSLAGFIQPFKPYQHVKRSVYYRVIDEYTLFYFKWIEGLRNALFESSLEPTYWSHIYGSQEWCSWAGYAFEAICYKHIPKIRKKLGLPPTALPYGWRYTPKKQSGEIGAQIDLLFDRKDDAITLCEIKYTQDPFLVDKHYAKTLLNKENVFAKVTKTKKQIFTVLVSANGLKDNTYSDDVISGLVVLEDLF